MEKQKLNQFKQLLIKERDRILDEITKEGTYDEALVKDIGSGDIFDQASAMIEVERIRGIDDTKRKTLNMINNALSKITNGTFGICEGTGKPIEEERLLAIPYTPFSLEYAKQKAKRKKPYHMRGLN